MTRRIVHLGSIDAETGQFRPVDPYPRESDLPPFIRMGAQPRRATETPPLARGPMPSLSKPPSNTHDLLMLIAATSIISVIATLILVGVIW